MISSENEEAIEETMVTFMSLGSMLSVECALRLFVANKSYAGRRFLVRNVVRETVDDPSNNQVNRGRYVTLLANECLNQIE